MSRHKLSKPVWWKNTYFWIAGILFVLGLVALFPAGAEAVRDPGQRREGFLWLVYMGGAAVMLLNGWLSHRLTVMHYNESSEVERG